MRPSFKQQFDAKWVVDPASECWIWAATTDGNGYGRIKPTGKRVAIPAHRASYEMHVGPIPPGLVIDHLCRNPPCVNPEHLEPVTQGENVSRGIGSPAENSRKSQCLRGHEFTPENTYVYQRSGKAPARLCRTCRAFRAKVADPKIGNPKLSADQVSAIRNSYDSGQANQRKLAEMYGVSNSTINAIVRRKAWNIEQKAAA